MTTTTTTTKTIDSMTMIEEERRHELELAKIRARGNSPGILPLFGATLFGGAVMAVVALGIQLGVTQPIAERREAQLEQKAATANERANELDSQLRDREIANETLQDKLAAADARIAELSAKPKQVATRPALVPTTTTTTRVNNAQPIPAPPPPPAPTCLKGDPLCPTI